MELRVFRHCHCEELKIKYLARFIMQPFSLRMLLVMAKAESTHHLTTWPSSASSVNAKSLLPRRYCITLANIFQSCLSPICSRVHKKDIASCMSCRARFARKSAFYQYMVEMSCPSFVESLRFVACVEELFGGGVGAVPRQSSGASSSISLIHFSMVICIFLEVEK